MMIYIKRKQYKTYQLTSELNPNSPWKTTTFEIDALVFYMLDKQNMKFMENMFKMMSIQINLIHK